METGPYTIRDIQQMLQLSPSVVRGMVRAGLVRPGLGARRKFLFSFQDLIVLRAARSLMQARIPQRRIRRSLQELRKRLPDTVPLSGLSISAVDGRVAVREGRHHWHADSGQYWLGFDVTVDHGRIQVVEHAQARGRRRRAEDWFDRALRLEESNPRAAALAYERMVEHEPDRSEAWINWGRILHEQGELEHAESVYRKGLERCGADPVLLFNLGVLLEDRGELDAATQAYQAALSEEPDFADCHFNLARLYEALGKLQHAIRHLGRYRRLTAEPTC